jgi:hypothetical protein
MRVRLESSTDGCSLSVLARYASPLITVGSDLAPSQCCVVFHDDEWKIKLCEVKDCKGLTTVYRQCLSDFCYLMKPPFGSDIAQLGGRHDPDLGHPDCSKWPFQVVGPEIQELN